MDGWMNKWMNKWIKEWMNEWWIDTWEGRKCRQQFHHWEELGKSISRYISSSLPKHSLKKKTLFDGQQDNMCTMLVGIIFTKSEVGKSNRVCSIFDQTFLWRGHQGWFWGQLMAVFIFNGQLTWRACLGLNCQQKKFQFEKNEEWSRR